MKTLFVEAQLTHATRTPDLGYPEFFALMTSAGAVAPHPDLGSWHKGLVGGLIQTVE